MQVAAHFWVLAQSCVQYSLEVDCVHLAKSTLSSDV